MIPDTLAVGPARWHAAADVVVVGSGAAGLSAALTFLESGVDVALVTKGRLGDGASDWAQGGLAAVTDPADTLSGHIEDTLAAGAGLCEPAAVAELAAAAPEAIRGLVELGVDFDREGDGSLALGLEGGHHARRIVHAGGDASGAAVIRALVTAVGRAAGPDRTWLHEDAIAVDALLSADGAVCGLRMIDRDGVVGELRAGAVILATGGIGQAWPVTSNPASATGDGLALALRAGAIVRDVEFVQFHPTVLVPPAEHRGGRAALISEAVRGEGARLTDTEGGAVTAGVHPLGDLAPRDVVAAAIHRQMTLTGSDHVLLDATGFGAATWGERFPTILALCLERGIDPRREPIPVAPAAHYACGGVLADLDGVTSVPGLYAIGEVASTGVQGANRLASNSVTEALIAGRRVAGRLVDGMSSEAPGPNGSGRPAPCVPGALLDPRLRDQIVAATGAGCGVLRSASGLRAQLRALGELSTTPRGRPQPAGDGRAGDSDGDGGHIDRGGGNVGLRDAVEVTNLHAVSTLVATAALHRTESRGCHRRSDFREALPSWHAHQLLRIRDGEIREAQTVSAVAA